ncbi:MAG TPA: hypothetical protein VF599_16930, partial [Pyrinomonadaceae bacterium]
MAEEKETKKETPTEQAKQENEESSSEKATQQKPSKTSKPTSPKRNSKTKKKSNKKAVAKLNITSSKFQAKYPRHALKKTLRIPRAILEQNAGKECTDKEAVGFLGISLNGEMRMELSSGIKYGFLERPAAGKVKVSELARKILRPQQPNDEIEGLREAILKAPDISDVYKHYRGENLPDPQFFDNALVDTFHIPQSESSKFKTIFIESLRDANLLEQHNEKWRVLDVSVENTPNVNSDTIKKLGKSVSIGANDSCFVIMPFAPPLGNHYSLIFEPAIEKAGLKPVRADADIFATGKIMDQVWRGISAAKVMVAELTSRNPNVFYELGLAHALKKPVVLISSNEEDVPFDVRHIRVIYYNVNDPFWGEKLIAKVAENILSAIKNPEEAIFEGAVN